MQQGNFINVLLARHVSGTYVHHQEHWMLSCSIWFSAPSLWLGGGLESLCVGRVHSAQCALCTVHTTHSAALMTTTHPQTRCRKPYAATQHSMLLMMDVISRHHPHRTHDLRRGSHDHHPSTNSVPKTIGCNSTSNAPDDRRMYPKHVELRIH
jgi:hypothetical protein